MNHQRLISNTVGQQFISYALGALLLVTMLGGVRTAAKADTASTAAIAAGAAAIVGTLLYDANRRPYYVRNNHRYYVSQDQARYYTAHRRGQSRPAYAANRNHPVAHDQRRGNDRGHQVTRDHGHDHH